jgi:DtxR family Mn-dependent transcriptional regulator
MTSEKSEEYLESIHKLEQIERPVRPSKLAEHLNVSPPAVAEMIKKLVRDGYVERTEDNGILLTIEGEKRAVGLVRQHRLWERFLTDVLGLSWDKVHDRLAVSSMWPRLRCRTASSVCWPIPIPVRTAIPFPAKTAFTGGRLHVPSVNSRPVSVAQ